MYKVSCMLLQRLLAIAAIISNMYKMLQIARIAALLKYAKFYGYREIYKKKIWIVFLNAKIHISTETHVTWDCNVGSMCKTPAICRILQKNVAGFLVKVRLFFICNNSIICVKFLAINVYFWFKLQIICWKSANCVQNEVFYYHKFILTKIVLRWYWV